MFLINPIQHWQIILLVALIQSIAVILIAWLLRLFIRSKYSNPTSSYQLFDCSSYNLRPDFDNSQCFQNSLVLVEFYSDRTIKSETFYTSLGGVIYFEYENGHKIQTRSLKISSFVLITFGVPGILMMIAFNILNISGLFIDLDLSFLSRFLNLAKFFLGIFMWSGIILIYSPFFKDEASSLSQ